MYEGDPSNFEEYDAEDPIKPEEILEEDQVWVCLIDIVYISIMILENFEINIKSNFYLAIFGIKI